ncbi:NUDIX hydrolase [Marinivivus vitaminiproducens]|uniref:NUDIX hydrolase n=1 Tax=Marinivivus vitaminiproducens TaxID=3035935 RepID=UPI002798D170|nr:NUDIX hydrolase [Geminicoccaceae bacterium SCSIO 64248]
MNALRPVVAALAVVVRDGSLLLVQRAHPPDAGLWGFPGGRIEPGETILAAAERELLEETGIRADATEVITALDAFDRDEANALRHHFVLIAVRCRWHAGEPAAADDALDARWVQARDIERGAIVLSRDVAALAARAVAMRL